MVPWSLGALAWGPGEVIDEPPVGTNYYLHRPGYLTDTENIHPTDFPAGDADTTTGFSPTVPSDYENYWGTIYLNKTPSTVDWVGTVWETDIPFNATFVSARGIMTYSSDYDFEWYMQQGDGIMYGPVFSLASPSPIQNERSTTDYTDWPSSRMDLFITMLGGPADYRPTIYEWWIESFWDVP